MHVDAQFMMIFEGGIIVYLGRGLAHSVKFGLSRSDYVWRRRYGHTERACSGHRPLQQDHLRPISSHRSRPDEFMVDVVQGPRKSPGSTAIPDVILNQF